MLHTSCFVGSTRRREQLILVSIWEMRVKTSRSAWNDYQAEDQSEQLLLYADLVRRLIPGKQLRLQFAVITKAKVPKVQLLEANFDESKLDRTKRIFENVWSAIQSGHFYPAPSPMQCPGCGYRSQCVAWRG